MACKIAVTITIIAENYKKQEKKERDDSILNRSSCCVISDSFPFPDLNFSYFRS